MTQTYGVDFGTSCSSIAIRDGAGGLISVPLDGGHFTMPSSVCRTAAGELLVGAPAEHWRVGQWGGYRRFVKQDVGRHGPFSLAGVPTEVVDMVAAILSHLRTQALRLDPTPPDRVVLTVPAAWESNRVDVLISAAAKAGFDPHRLRVELEPAAALAYVFADQALTEDKTVLVYDLGGGTFDCAVAHGRSGAFEIRPHYGALDLVGGRLFDRAIWEIIDEQYPDRVARLYEPGGDSLALSDRLSFDATCEQIKIWLSEHGEYSGAVPELRLDALKVTREQFEAGIAGALDATFDTCLSVLDEIGITWEDVDIIAPVGGSSRIPAVVTMLQRRTQRKVIGTSDPELAVARGAALLAANLEPVSVVPAPREALAPQLAANPWPGRQLEAGPSGPGPSTVVIPAALPFRDQPGTDEVSVPPALPLTETTGPNAGQTDGPTDGPTESAAWAGGAEPSDATDPGRLPSAVRYRLKPRGNPVTRRAGVALLVVAALGAVATLLAGSPAGWLAVAVALLLSLLALRQGRPRELPAFSIGRDGIQYGSAALGWAQVRGVEFREGARGRCLVVTALAGAPSIRLMINDFWATEYELREVIGRYGPDRLR